MQNRTCSANEAGFVTLSGRWGCPRCGCANECGDVCRDCGWNRCGGGPAGCCQGGVVWTQTQSTRTACNRETASACSREKACDDCPASLVTGHRVQRCPDNTRIRRDKDCGCKGEAATYQTCASKTDCGCKGETATYQTCANKPDCGCKGENATYQTCASKNDCGCMGETTTYQTCSKNDCGCTGDESRHYGRNRGVGIVHAVEQQLADVFESESALRTGTLFPELHKPMNGRCPACSNCSTGDQQSSFAAWDLRLYLNTHPDDKEALALFRRLCDEAEDPNYATAFLEGKGCGWGWTDDPWPWECQKCGD